MGLVVSAQVIRELIVEGDYVVECIEQRERGKVAVALALRSRDQPYRIQIDTMDNKLGGLFRALFDDKPSPHASAALVKVGSQPVQVVEVEAMPADTAKGRRGRSRKSPVVHEIKEPRRAVSPGRSSTGQLILMPQEASHEATATPPAAKRRRAARANNRPEGL